MTPLAARIMAAVRARPQTYDELAATLAEPRPRIAGAVNSMNGYRQIAAGPGRRWAPTPKGIREHDACVERLRLDP